MIIVTARNLGPRSATTNSGWRSTPQRRRPVVPDFLDQIGYRPQHGDRITSITSAIGDEPGYFRIHVHDLPLGIQGLLGLSLLRQVNYENRSVEGRIRTTRIQDVPSTIIRRQPDRL